MGSLKSRGYVKEQFAWSITIGTSPMRVSTTCVTTFTYPPKLCPLPSRDKLDQIPELPAVLEPLAALLVTSLQMIAPPTGGQVPELMGIRPVPPDLDLHLWNSEEDSDVARRNKHSK